MESLLRRFYQQKHIKFPRLKTGGIQAYFLKIFINGPLSIILDLINSFFKYETTYE